MVGKRQLFKHSGMSHCSPLDGPFLPYKTHKGIGNLVITAGGKKEKKNTSAVHGVIFPAGKSLVGAQTHVTGKLPPIVWETERNTKQKEIKQFHLK